VIDLHSHVLPGIDDGAGSQQDAIEMCRLAGVDGIEVIVATPHQRHQQWTNADPEGMERLRAALQTELGARPRIELGAEVGVDSELLSELDRPGRGGIVSLAGSRYLLIEFHSSGIGPDPAWVIHELVVAGWRPVVAHPERVRWLAEDIDLARDLVERGAHFQLTAMSLTGGFGRKLQARADALLREGLVDFVASDMHGVRSRPPGLSAAYERLAKDHGETMAERWMHDNPLCVLEDRPLPTVCGRLAPDVPSQRMTSHPIPR
jgi:protein-tyrosine phosphatase